MRTTDFYDDVNQQTLYALEKLTGVPDFVKGASIETKDEIGKLPPHVFADPQHRKFPVHTKAATWLAHAYFKQCAPRYSNEERGFIQQRISKAAGFWKIAGPIAEFDQQWDRLHAFHAPNDLPDDQYALIYKTAEHTIRKFPMPNPACVKLAGERLFADRHRYTYPMRKFAARRILRAQKTAGVTFQPETAEYLARASGEGSAIPLDLSVKLAQRAIMIKRSHPDLALKLAELAETIENEKYLSAAKLEKLAGLVDSADQATGLFRYYYEGVPMPEEFCFNIQEKEAQAYVDAHVQLTTGNVFTQRQLRKLPLEKFSEALGSDFAQAVSDASGLKIDWDKFAEVAPTLPRDDAKLLEHIIKAAGVENLTGGKADGIPDSAFPKAQLDKGMKVETEHTENKKVAKEITKDHLEESPKYYTELSKMEGKLDKAARVDPTKFTAKSTEKLFQAMGHDVEDGDTVDFKKIIRFKTGR
jgi:hypothetical protein